MKRILLILLCVLMLSGCGTLAPDSYLSVTPHVDTSIPTAPIDAATADDYESLKEAILTQIRAGQTEGIIHVTQYDGVVEDDLKSAAYEVSKLDPLGAYAVDYMTHSSTLLVSYYELRVSVTFRRTAEEIAQIQTVITPAQLEEKLGRAIDQYATRLALRLPEYDGQEQDIPALVAEYCSSNASTVMETPQVSVSVYPESGKERILEINFLYESTSEELQEKQEAVRESLHAAAEYIRYRQSEYDKALLLYSYLAERFQYTSSETVTPLFDALCNGVADPTGLARAWQLICDRAGMECHLVTGMKDGEPYVWNILRTGTYYRHLDLTQCLLDGAGLVLRTDGEMGRYYWNTGQFPACVAPAEPEQAPAPEEPEPDAQIPAEEDDEPQAEP